MTATNNDHVECTVHMAFTNNDTVYSEQQCNHIVS